MTIRSACAALLLAMVACGGGGPSTPGGSPGPPAATSGGNASSGDTSSGDDTNVGPTFEDDPDLTTVGHPTFASPHAHPIGLLPDGSLAYVANTPADTVDVLDTVDGRVVTRINVGIDPVAIAVRPDGREIWVANHLSDSVSVIDSDPSSPTRHQVIATVQAFDDATHSTRFDEPVGVAFVSNVKAYVALSSENAIAVIDVPNRSVVRRLEITAQDPRAITVRGDRLYVVAFESGNQTELSGCFGAENIDGNQCTFDLQEHVVDNNNVLSLGYDADIVRDPRIPDRDLFVFDTTTDALVNVVSTVGTLLYGVAADSTGKVFIAQTDARNDANGRAGTLKQKLVDLENRAFLNQIAVVDCSSGGCAASAPIELEPLPPTHPAPGMAIATPYGIQISGDDSILVVTAAGSNKLVTLNASTGAVLGRVVVGGTPRGVALRSGDDGAPQRAWVLNALANTVSVVNLSSPAIPVVELTIALEDPTHPDVKQGRLAFNNADASSTGTYSCESCHPDGNIDQLLWVLGGPQCDIPGCTQIPVRNTMPIRGLRDSAPYHWDGVPGDPFGGRNATDPFNKFPPNCDSPESCTRHVLDGALATTMCDLTDCPTNDEGKDGLLSAAERDAMAVFLLSVPYPPGRERPFDDQLTPVARRGFGEFFDNGGRPSCGRVGCHEMPFWEGTNGSGSGMDAPTFRGLPDRWLILPQGRINMFELVSVVGPENAEVPFDAAKGFDELSMWTHAGFGTEQNPGTNRIESGIGPLGPWQMFLEASMGTSGSFARQVTLNKELIDPAVRSKLSVLLDALEQRAAEGAIRLQGEGVAIVDQEVRPRRVVFASGEYTDQDDGTSMPRTLVLDEAAAGRLLLTLTGRLGPNVDADHPQPQLWSPREQGFVRHDFPRLTDANEPMLINGRHIPDDARVIVDGRRVVGAVGCTTGGTLPACDNEEITIQLSKLPGQGMHLLQLQAPGGLLSNEFLMFVEG